MKHTVKFFLMACSALVLGFATGCSNSDDSSAAAQQPIVNDVNETADTALTPSGDTVEESMVVSHDICAAERADALCGLAGDELKGIYDKYDGLEEDVMALTSIDKVVKTANGTYDLYDGDVLMMTLSHNGTEWVVSGSTVDVDLTSISFDETSAQEQSTLNAIDFGLMACAAPEEEQEQEQEQEGVKEEEQGKDQARGAQEEEQGKDEEQGKEEEQGKDECINVNVTLFLDLVEQPKEEEQGKEEEQAKEEEQGKEEPVEEPKQEEEQEQEQEGPK